MPTADSPSAYGGEAFRRTWQTILLTKSMYARQQRLDINI
jgi:hypothetical protein